MKTDGKKELIKNVVTQFVEGSNQEQIWLLPVIDHIKKLGKPIQNSLISYHSEKEKMDVFVGQDPINSSATISILELKKLNPKKLILYV